MSHDVGFGDGAVNVGDDDLVRGLPPVDVALTAGGTLVSRSHTELGLIGARLELKLFLKKGEEFLF